MEKQFFVYIATNSQHTVLYIGVTNDLARRISEHRTKSIPGFTAKYNIGKLVYYEEYGDPESAIAREKQLKAGPRRKKLQLIEQMNPEWKDLGLQL